MGTDPGTVESERCFLCKSPSKYRCPVCGCRSCSAGCVKQHKILRACTGAIDPARMLARSELLTVANLDRDYNFLQRVGRDIQIEKFEPRGKRPRTMERNGVKVSGMPSAMSRARQNRSGWNKKDKVFVWTVELVGEDSLVRHVPDTTPLTELGSRLALRAADGKLSRLNMQACLGDALKGHTVVEFPTLIEISADMDLSSSGSSGSDASDSDSSEESSDKGAGPDAEPDPQGEPAQEEQGGHGDEPSDEEPPEETPVTRNVG